MTAGITIQAASAASAATAAQQAIVRCAVMLYVCARGSRNKQFEQRASMRWGTAEARS